MIDIRHNSGGTDAYWQEALVAPLTEQKLEQTQTICFRSGEHAEKAVKSAIGMGYFFIRQPRSLLTARANVPPELASEAFADPVMFKRTVHPLDPVGFAARITLLVDDWVYSAAEAFAAFSKATGFATLVGTRTGGDGPGFTPLLSSLPHTGLVFRMSYTMGLNPDGTANEETATTPHIYVEKTPEDYIYWMQKDTANLEEDTILQTVLAMVATDSLALPPHSPSVSRAQLGPQVSLNEGLHAGVQLSFPLG